MEKWKVAYAEVGTKLKTCVIPSKLGDPILGERYIMVDHSAYFISCDSRKEALYLSAILNSDRSLVMMIGLKPPQFLFIPAPRD